MKMKLKKLQAMLANTLVGAGLMMPQIVQAHCDTLDGPVVQAAQVALAKKDVTPVLKWVNKDGEDEVKAAFAKALVVRVKGPEARELADQFFFETLVRVHRAGEGEPFTGLKPAGTELSPAVAAADRALESGSADKVVNLVTDDVATGIRRRFAEAHEKRHHADESVEAGREYVAAYVEYVHYVEGLHTTAQGASPHHKDVPVAAEHSAHKQHP